MNQIQLFLDVHYSDVQILWVSTFRPVIFYI